MDDDKRPSTEEFIEKMQAFADVLIAAEYEPDRVYAGLLDFMINLDPEAAMFYAMSVMVKDAEAHEKAMEN